MGRPTITGADLKGLLEIGFQRDIDHWVEDQGFDEKALVGLIGFLIETWRVANVPIEILVLNTFIVGWDAHRDLRGERDA